MTMADSEARAWHADGYLIVSEAEPGTAVPDDVEDWIRTDSPVAVRS